MYYKYIRVNSCSFVAGLFFYFCVLSAFSVANAEVKGDMDTLANQTKYIADTFMQKSVEVRLGYEYRQGFASDAQAQSLRELTQKAAVELDEIILAQEKLKKQIENYNGDDWDSRYGDSGVWRMAGEDICATKILKCQMEYYRAIASPPHQQPDIVRGGLSVLGLLPDVPQVLLVKADMYALLGKTDRSSKELAGELYRKILATENSHGQLYYTAAAASQKLNPPQSPAVLDELAAQLGRSECKDNFELTMLLAFLQRQLGSTAILEKTVQRWPRAKAFVGDLILSDLASKTPSQISKLSTFEADCVATAAMQKDAPRYPDILDAMSRIPRLQTPGLLNAAAVAQAQKSPARAIELFIKASLLPREPNDGRESPVSMAKQGAALALNYFKGDPNRCEIVKCAVENYFSLTGNAADAQIEYLYSDMLSDCGDKTAAEKLLKKIAAGSSTEFAPRAKDDLSTLAINKSQLLLEQGQLFEAANILIAADVNVCNCRVQVMSILEKYVEKIDEYMAQNAPNRALTLLGARLVGCNDTQGGANAALLYAQAAIFDANGQKDKLDEIEKLLKPLAENNLDFLTARARLSTAQGNYPDAAKQWSQICAMLKNEPNEPPQHSYKWWQAKYFELASSLKIPGANRADSIHSIEVLQSSFDQIPPFWDKKLKALQAAKN
jgi:hypothetical protein